MTEDQTKAKGNPSLTKPAEMVQDAAGGDKTKAPDAGASKPVDQSQNHHVIDLTFPDAKVLFRTFPSVASIAETALFVLDASSLVAPFDIGKQFQDIEKVVKDVADQGRLFVPERAVREFVKNRSSNMARTYQALSEPTIPEFPSPTELTSSVLFSAAAYQAMVESMKEMQAAAEKYRKHIADLKQHVKDWNCNDPISRLYESVFKPETFIKPDEDEAKLSGEFLANVGKKAMVVPGSKDIGSSSKGDGGIGDFVIWKSILALGKKMKKDVIFVSGDAKDDWVVAILKKGDIREAVYAKYELVAQYNAVSNGSNFAICNFPTFLKLCGAKEETIKDAERAESVRMVQEPTSTAEDAKAVIYRNISIGRGAVIKQLIAEIKLVAQCLNEFIEDQQVFLPERAKDHLLPRLSTHIDQLVESYQDYPVLSSSSSSSHDPTGIQANASLIIAAASNILSINQWLLTFSDTVSGLSTKRIQLHEEVRMFVQQLANFRVVLMNTRLDEQL